MRSRQDSYPVTSEIFGYVLLAAFFAEFLARTKAQGGEHFFRPLYNKLLGAISHLFWRISHDLHDSF